MEHVSAGTVLSTMLIEAHSGKVFCTLAHHSTVDTYVGMEYITRQGRVETPKHQTLGNRDSTGLSQSCG